MDPGTGRKKLVYCTNVMSSFVRNDVELLRTRFDVSVFHFAVGRKISTPLLLLRQFFFLVTRLPRSAVSVTQFAGYHSLLPVLLGRLFRVPSLVVLGGTDCARFPSIGYGDHTRRLLGWFSLRSIANATHLSPVDGSLVECEYVYTRSEGDPPRQGYKGLFPWVDTPHTTLAYGYDDDRFRPQGGREPGTFLTVSRMSGPNIQRKGIDLFFAMALRFPQCKFTLLGDVPGMKYPPVPPNVTILRTVPYEELPAYYSRFTFYMQLSMWEGFPSAPCEAMLCGCVPIVSRVAALPAIVGDAGFILDHKDPEALAILMGQALLADTERMGEQARNRIRTHYPQETRKKLLHLIGSELMAPGNR